VLQRDPHADLANDRHFESISPCRLTFLLWRNNLGYRFDVRPIKNRRRVDHLHLARNGKKMGGMRLRVVAAILCGRSEACDENQQGQDGNLRENAARKRAPDESAFRCYVWFHLGVSGLYCIHIMLTTIRNASREMPDGHKRATVLRVSAPASRRSSRHTFRRFRTPSGIVRTKR
jgi:hypothetical protein